MLSTSPTFGDQVSITTRPEQRSGKPPLAIQANNSNNRIRWGLIGLAALAGWIGLLTIIVLQSTRGQLVVESFVPGVKINVLRDGELYDQFTIQADAETLKLYADRYEIEVPNGEGQLQVEA